MTRGASRRTRRILAVGSIVLLSALLFLAAWTSSVARAAGSKVGVLSPQASPTSIPDPFPTTPPDASKITVGEADVDGNAAITGTAGAVQPLSAVMIVNLSANNLITTTADSTGAFSSTLYAPPGSSLLVKYDTDGEYVGRTWGTAQTWTTDALYFDANLLPGAILHVGPPPHGGDSYQGFHILGSIAESGGWTSWTISGTLQVPPSGSPGLAVQAGDPVTLTARLRVTSPGLGCTGTPTTTISGDIRLRHLFGSDGRAEPWGMWFNAHLFTPTGLPIEHEGPGEERSVGPISLSGLTCASSNTVEGLLETTFTVPADLPDGVYLPTIAVYSDLPSSQGMRLVPVWFHDETSDMPPLTVGSPATPRIPWTLLGDYPVNGHRGLQAREDVGHFAMPTRVLFPPHQVVIPRVDERSGELLTYRLDPGSNWLSATDRRMPNPPHIPLDLPSGHLIVEVIKPDFSIDQLGPVPIKQSAVRTPSIPGGELLAEGTGHVADMYHLTTMDEAFAYSFDQYGPHVISLSGEVDDVYGNTYAVQGTYDVTVARVLDLDPAQLPTTPYEEGDAFAPGLHVFPPVPADVTVRLVQMPYSDPTQAITDTIPGQANRFGYFQPDLGTAILLEDPGEFRVDLTAEYEAADGTLWMGAMTWGNVVEGPAAKIEAHGRRGMDYKDDTIDDMLPWFTNASLQGTSKFKDALENYYPYFSGDIHWGDETPDRTSLGDSIHSIITLKDLTGPKTVYNTLRNHFSRAKNCFRWPPEGCTLAGLEKRIDVGEAPLFITTESGVDPGVDPEDIDLWGYWYGSSQRPDVRVREIISEDGMGTAYWRFHDTYGYQIGEPADGDQPGDIKWEFGGVVFRTITDTNPLNEYAIYSSLWVLLPHYDPVGARVTAPFQDAVGAGVNGGPILTLLEEEIDMLFLPKGVRPGDVLEVGDVVSFSGHVGPPLDSLVSVTITSPSDTVRSRAWHANKIGWIYDPSFDFLADEPGRWTVDVSVVHDRAYAPTGIIPASHNTGTVLGTTGQYEFYVVEPGSTRLLIDSPSPGFIVWPTIELDPVHIQGVAPSGATAVYYTFHDKGVVMGQGSVTPDSSGAFSITYDAGALHQDFSMLSITAHEGRWQGLADEVAINLLAVGGPEPQGNTVTLIGEEVFVVNDLNPQSYLPVVQRRWTTGP